MDIKVMRCRNGKLVELDSNDERYQSVSAMLNQLFKNDGNIEANKIKNEEIEEMRNKEDNKKSMIDYDREYDIHEVFTLLSDMPKGTRVVDDEMELLWELDELGQSLFDRGTPESDEYRDLVDCYHLHDILTLAFKLVKEDKEEWIEIKTLSELIGLLESNKINKLKVDDEIFEFTEIDSQLELFSDMVLSVFELSVLNTRSLSYVAFEK